MINKLRFSLGAVILLLASCGVADTGLSIDPVFVRSSNATLEQEYAQIRGGQVDGVKYSLSIDLTSEGKFTGVAEIAFNLKRTDIPLTVDFNDGEVIEVLLDNQPVPFSYNGWFITIAPDDLLAGSTELVIKYAHDYSSVGSGLYRFTDPEDNRDYLYTDFEPYDANRLFPSFDQPDLKASYTLDVIAPLSWQVVTSVRESSIENNGDVNHWYFPESARYSTYIFSLHAGEYKVWESKAGDIPLRLFARQSLAEYVVPEDWFSFTRHGFKFFQDYLEVPYAYVKYDQLIVPHFNAGAMENTAAITFSERYIRRGSYTQDNLNRINNVIQHEMAHMWFGNLVTMRWWNGVWLNESLATYMAYLAQAAYPEDTSAWLRFYLGNKISAYTTDEQVTTHAIDLPVADSDSAFANFDSITYGKGASLLKQLAYLLGEQPFRNGITNYLNSKSGQNTTLDDLVSSLAVAAGRDLNDWTQQWFYTKGPNTIAVDYQCEGGTITGISLTQSAPDDAPTLREHQLALGLYSGDELVAQERVGLTGATTRVDTLLDEPCPEFVFPNQGDWAYAKMRLAEKDYAQLAVKLHNFDDPLDRAMLWRALWEGVRDLRMPITDYSEILLANIAQEKSPSLLLGVFNNLDSVISYYYSFGDEYAEQRNAFIQRYEEIAWRQVRESDAGSDRQKSWFDNLVYNTQSETGLNRLAELLKGDTSIDGLDIDQDRRWSLVTHLGSHNHPDSAQLIEQELLKDPSDQGAKAALGARVASASIEDKAAYLLESQNLENSLELAERNQITQRLFQRNQPEVKRVLLADALGAIQSLDQQAQQQVLRGYVRGLTQGYCSPESVELLQQALSNNQTATLSTIKVLRVAIQQDQRCIDIKNLL